MIKIDTQPVVYYSSLDEDHFFTWAQQIACIKSIDEGYFRNYVADAQSQLVN